MLYPFYFDRLQACNLKTMKIIKLFQPQNYKQIKNNCLLEI